MRASPLLLAALFAFLVPAAAVRLASGAVVSRSRVPAGRALVAMQATVDAKTVKTLRDMTGAGMMDCKKALLEHDGDMDKATEMLRQKGLASADKKAGRAAKEGIIETYIHTGSKLGVMVEVNCETDFVAKRPEFQELAKAIAMQAVIAQLPPQHAPVLPVGAGLAGGRDARVLAPQVAASPSVTCVREEDIDAAWLEKEKKIEAASEDLQGKPENIVEKIVEGRINKLVKTKLLLQQPYIRDPNMTVDELVKSYISKLGENIKVARFVRFNMGEGQSSE